MTEFSAFSFVVRKRTSYGACGWAEVRAVPIAHLIITRWTVGQNAPLESFRRASAVRQIDELLDYMA